MILFVSLYNFHFEAKFTKKKSLTTQSVMNILLQFITHKFTNFITPYCWKHALPHFAPGSEQQFGSQSHLVWKHTNLSDPSPKIAKKFHPRKSHAKLFCLSIHPGDTFDGTNPASVDMINICKYQISHYFHGLMVLCIPGGAGFLPSTACLKISHIHIRNKSSEQ